MNRRKLRHRILPQREGRLTGNGNGRALFSRQIPSPHTFRPGANVSNLVRILLAIFLPPIAVLVTEGIGLQFLLNILLTILGIVPGMVHALWIIMRRP